MLSCIIVLGPGEMQPRHDAGFSLPGKYPSLMAGSDTIEGTDHEQQF